MAQTAFKTPGTTVNADRNSKIAWANTDNAKTDNAQYATQTMGSSPDYSDWLRLTNYGFTSADIPAGATIDGIVVHIQRKSSYMDNTKDSAIYLRKTSGQIGDNKASSTYWPMSEEEAVYGGAADTWNAGLTQADIVSSDFGIDISVVTLYGWIVSSIDVIEISIYYTAGDVNVTPNCLNATGAVLAPGVSAGANVSSSILNSAGAILSPVISAGANCNASVLNADSAVLPPSLSCGVNLVMNILNANGAVLAPSLKCDVNLVMNMLEAIGAVLAPGVSAGANVNVNMLEAISAVLPPSLAGVIKEWIARIREANTWSEKSAAPNSWIEKTKSENTWQEKSPGSSGWNEKTPPNNTWQGKQHIT
jgi:hypothetical protein